jgi:hypothetical protein
MTLASKKISISTKIPRYVAAEFFVFSLPIMPVAGLP